VASAADTDILKLYKEESTRNKSLELLIDKYQQKLYWHIRKIVIDHDDSWPILKKKALCLPGCIVLLPMRP
jgi:RNA polymerase sigma-70 factor (ECF subfamily)